MKNHASYRVGWLLALGSPLLFAGGCSHDSKRVGLYPASHQVVDVFTCKGLDEEGHWIEVTDQFLPDVDPYVVVAAQLHPNHRGAWITYELTSPADFVVTSETVRYPKEADLGVHFDLERLIEMGGEGEWVAVVYADGNPLGKATFMLGERKEEAGKLSRYHVIKEEELVSEPFELPLDALETVEPLSGEEIESATEPLTPAGRSREGDSTSPPATTPVSPRE